MTSVRRKIYFIALILLCLLLIPSYLLLRSHSNRELVSGVISDPVTTLNSSDGVTNILLLGFGGVGHTAPYLTDTIIFISLRHRDHRVSLVSVPRDLWVDSLSAKLNTAYELGNEKSPGGGRALAKATTSELLGQPVHYMLALDFNSFVSLIDKLGGVDVNVPAVLDDYEYPIPGQEDALPESARYEHLHFDQGPTHMDGATALKYARSRHAVGEEGTDFDRSKRQQLIISSLEDKVFSSTTLLNFDKLQDILASAQGAVDTDLTQAEFVALFKFFLKYKERGSTTHSVDLTPLLINPKNRAPYAGQWVLIPSPDLAALRSYVAKNLDQ